MNQTTFNGYKNYQTWNVSLYILNSEDLYETAKECNSYKEFVDYMFECEGIEETKDGVRYDDSSLDTHQLNELVKDLRDEF